MVGFPSSRKGEGLDLMDVFRNINLVVTLRVIMESRTRVKAVMLQEETATD